MRLPLRFFPSFTAYLDKRNNKVHFEYLGFLESDISCVTLHAQTCQKPHKDIVVKFVERYCQEAHELLAQQHLAPELLYYGKPSLENGAPNYGELSMVVMEFIHGETLLVAKNRVDRVEVKGQVERAIHLLHQVDIVFGDLRKPNVMITNQNEVRLIDFNWAGKAGEAEYPYLISPAIAWPPGVEPLSLMEKRHDLVMLERLI
ncbi:hypothetical protein APHAL10511_003289 [Amanita phalloides]|nr:hypothetical protein APHAL10511_003289 [Amanita phalloides]